MGNENAPGCPGASGLQYDYGVQCLRPADHDDRRAVFPRKRAACNHVACRPMLPRSHVRNERAPQAAALSPMGNGSPRSRCSLPVPEGPGVAPVE